MSAATEDDAISSGGVVAKDLSAPLLPVPGRAGAGGARPGLQEARRRKMWFDGAFAALFVALAVAVAVLGLTLGVSAVANRRLPSVVTVDPVTEQPAGRKQSGFEGVKLLGGVLIACAVALVMTMVWVQVLVCAAPYLLLATILGALAMGMGAAIAFFATGSTWGGVVTLLTTVTAIVYFRALRRRASFAAANVKVACAALRGSPPVFAVGLGLLLCQVCWSLVWALALMGVATNGDVRAIRSPTTERYYPLSTCSTLKTYAPSHDFSPTCATAPPGSVCYKCMCAGEVVYTSSPCFSYRLYAGWVVFLVLAFMWGCTVIRNVGHCAVSGTVGTWWVSGSERSSASVWGHVERTVTGSFGSICLGSLLVATICVVRETLLLMHRSNRRLGNHGSNALGAVLDCLLALLDRAVRMFNKYALVYVALYGLDFVTASQAVTDLFRARGITAIVNETLVDGALTFGWAAVGLVCAVCGYGYGVGVHLSRANKAIVATASGFVGAAIGMVVSALVDSAVSTAFVCFAEDPRSLEICHPELSEELEAAWESLLQGPLPQTDAREKHTRTSSDAYETHTPFNVGAVHRGDTHTHTSVQSEAPTRVDPATPPSTHRHTGDDTEPQSAYTSLSSVSSGMEAGIPSSDTPRSGSDEHV